MSDGANPAAPADVERHGPVARLVLVAAGVLFALAGAALTAVTAFAAFEPTDAGRPLPLPAAAAIAALFVSIAAYGVLLVRRGVRGSSRRGAWSARASAWLLRHGYAFPLAMSAAVAALAIAQAGPAAFFLSAVGELRIAWFAFLVILVLPLHLAVHELGHALAGALVGFRFQSLRVGDLVVSRDGGRWRAGWNPMFSSLLGLQHAIPEGDDATIGVRAAVRTAAGPAATLVAALACRAGAAAVAPATGIPSAIAIDLLGAAGWAGLAMGVLNLLPFRTREGLVTDGAQLLGAVLPSSPGARTYARAARLCAQGRRPRTWGLTSAALLEAAEATRRARGPLLVFALAVALDTGDDAAADGILRRAAEAPPDPNVTYELALHAAMRHALRGDAAAAREQLAAIGGTHRLLPWYTKLAEATILLADGDRAGARAALDAWRAAVAASGVGNLLRAGNEWAIDALEARLGAAGPSGTARDG